MSDPKYGEPVDDYSNNNGEDQRVDDVVVSAHESLADAEAASRDAVDGQAERNSDVAAEQPQSDEPAPTSAPESQNDFVWVNEPEPEREPVNDQPSYEQPSYEQPAYEQPAQSQDAPDSHELYRPSAAAEPAAADSEWTAHSAPAADSAPAASATPVDDDEDGYELDPRYAASADIPDDTSSAPSSANTWSNSSASTPDTTATDSSGAALAATTAAGAASASPEPAAQPRTSDTPTTVLPPTTTPPASTTTPAAGDRDAATTPLVAATPLTQQPIFVQAPEPPRTLGNRGAAGGIGLLAAIVFGALYLAASLGFGLLAGDGTIASLATDAVAALTSWWFWVPVAVFFIGFWLLGAVINRGRWAHWVIFGLIVGAFAYGGHLLGQLFQAQFWTLPGSESLALLEGQWLAPLALVAFIIGREVTIWFGAWVAARGRRISEVNVEAQREYERTLEAGPQLSSL